MKHLLDTCVISELIRRNPEPKVVAWVDSLHDAEAYLSAITVGEIKRGAEKLPSSERQRAILHWLENDLLVRFEKRILPIDTTVMLIWGQLVATLDRAGRPLPAFDSLIAAIALTHHATIVTHNTGEFSRVPDLAIEDWEAAEAGA